MIGAPLAGSAKSLRVLVSGGMYELSKWGMGFNY